ncbi:hypothetical protein [Niabella drilacis]|uniref:Uncharacterized protein n=1 Tax=Niabella drilacis (strain DSM 25811 / CCM 8410 / CCUG 62505 / LMG 26954 / E90) TaxID=1285928 RepID=A0A1G6YB13_NIADE|nr:hypothetical protein [Niabella drilacis]SDD87183.1 hypothetical protein SAMN04487894_11537 [Niabella drilacis]
MEKQFIAAFSFFILLVTACGKNDVALPAREPEKDTVSLWANTENRLALPGYAGKGYMLVASDSSIAAAVWDGDGVRISAHTPGNTVITILDKMLGTSLMKITVFSRSVATAYGWRGVENTQWKTAVIVKAGNAAGALELQHQLLDSIKNEIQGSGFIFRGNEAAEYSRNRQLYKVAYVFKDWILVLNHEGWQEQIPLRPATYNVIGLTQDLTDRYKARYPARKISKVIITRYFTEVLPPG